MVGRGVEEGIALDVAAEVVVVELGDVALALAGLCYSLLVASSSLGKNEACGCHDIRLALCTLMLHSASSADCSAD